MDPGRYGLQQGWDNNSALEGHGAVHEPNFRIGGSYDERKFLDGRYSRGDIYPRNAFHRDIIDRDNYPRPPPQSVGFWPQSRRRSYEEEFPIDRESRRHEKQYIDHPCHEMDAFHDPDLDASHEFDKFRDGYRNLDNYRDHEFDKSSRFGGHDRDDYAHDDYDYRSHVSHQNREDSRERDYEYNWHSYDSDYDRGSRRDGCWRRRGSRDRERDQSPYRRHDWERDQSPYRRHERSRSRVCDDYARSRSPRGRSHGRSYREDSSDDARSERGERRRDREEKHQREPYSVAPSATVVVKGLSQKTTEEDLYQILAEWGPLRHVRVIKERNSGISRGFAFIDFLSVGAACAMMEKLGEDGLVVDGRKLFFEYSAMKHDPKMLLQQIFLTQTQHLYVEKD